MTDLRDRDDVIDRWLRRAASAPAGPGPNAACLDAEIMAAWADGGLSDAALKTVRAHVADCARCQVLAAVMTKLEPVGSGAADRRPGRTWARHPWRNWLVPLAAAAGAIAIYVFIPRQPPDLREGTTPPASEAQMAQKPADSAIPVPPPVPSTAPAQESAPSPTRPAAPKLKAEQQVAGDLKRQANEKDQNKPANVREEPRDRAQVTVAADPKKADTRATLPPPPAAPPPTVSLAQASADRAAAVVAGGGGRGGAGAGQRVSQFGESRLSKEIVSTDEATRWRISGGLVEKTTDAGRTWTPGATGIKAEFTAGAAPSPTTCWIVGRGGVVLLTTDGQKWESLRFPDPTDLSAVRATDARTATVTTIDGREYSTTDGGNTWIRR